MKEKANFSGSLSERELNIFSNFAPCIGVKVVGCIIRSGVNVLVKATFDFFGLLSFL